MATIVEKLRDYLLGLPAAATLDGTEKVPILQSGELVDTTTQDVANLGGGLESYQNSAMSAAVMAYVFRDENDSIYRVYEPIRNNDVSRSIFAYADSIDKVPFDNTDWFNNMFVDVKVIDFGANCKINGSTLATMIINVNSHTGLQLINHKQKGTYGVNVLNTYPNNTEMYITGDNVSFSNNDAGEQTFFDSVGANGVVKNSVFMQSDVYFDGHTDCTIRESFFATWAGMGFNSNSGYVQQAHLDALSYLDAHTATINNYHGGVTSYFNAVSVINQVTIGDHSNLDNTGGAMNFCFFGNEVNFTSAAPFTNKNVLTLGGAAYELGVTAGAVTAVAV